MEIQENDQGEPQRQVQEKQQQQVVQKDRSFTNPPELSMYCSPPRPLNCPPGSSLPPDQATRSYVLSPQIVQPPKPLSLALASTETKGQDLEVAGQAEGGDGDGNVSGIKVRPNLSILGKAKRENIKRRALLGFRILGFVFCLTSFSVLAADKNQGWALDSFYRYKEFRYCLSVNVIGFVYSGLQACDLARSLTTKKQFARNQIRHLLDFSLDQILAYLIISASSSASFRVEDWEANWGKDEFPAMAKASIASSFLSFVAFALSSLISGHTLVASL